MALIGRLHPLLIHFPIALVIVAVVAEGVAVVTARDRWRTFAVGNLRTGAAFALLAAIAGWRLAATQAVDRTSLLEWHRWLGTLAAGATVGAALVASDADDRSYFELWIYRITLFAAGMLTILAGHVGGLLVWGADFLRP
jgi:uncharacterized membrane protein